MIFRVFFTILVTMAAPYFFFFSPLPPSFQNLHLIISCALLEQLMGAVIPSFLEKSKLNYDDDYDDDYFSSEY